ncbi:SapC family protein [Desulfosoma sp.]
MAQWVPLSKERHGRFRFRAAASYSFARGDVLVSVCLAELARVVPAFPLVFVRRTEEAFAVCALMGLEPGANLFVDPKSGRWLADYVPAALRAYPFRLFPAEGTQVLCVDEESGMLHDGQEGEPLFDAEGHPSPFLSRSVQFLQQWAADDQRTLQACAALHAAGLIVPWPVTVRTDHGDRTLADLFQADDNRLHAVDGETLCRLRDGGALALAYAQRFSAWHVHKLGTLMGQALAAKRPTASDLGPPVTPSGELDLSFLIQ